ncbi:MAG: hypothetical protein ABI867_20505 [Kofleriaceae bacterium]
MGNRVILRDHRTATDSRHLTATLEPDGALRIEGHDLGDGVEQALGAGIREYEWKTEVSAADIPRLVRALDPTRDDANILDAIRATCVADPAKLEATIRSAGITPTFWSRMGD